MATFTETFREFFKARSMGGKTYPPASVVPPAYGQQLWDSGVRPDLGAKDADVPEWARAETYGRQVQEKFERDGGLMAQPGGTWSDFLDSAIKAPSQQLLARMIAARGPLPLPEQVKWIARGARNFPNDMDRIIAALPVSGGGSEHPLVTKFRALGLDPDRLAASITVPQ